jgi:hypothetical protein
MKSVYEQPSVAFVEFSPSGILAVSKVDTDPGSSIGSGTVDPEEAWTNGARGDWSDIWNGM